MVRIVLTACLALLLLGMQRDVVVHQVEHLRALLERGDHATLQKSAAGQCPHCALLASGSHGVPAPAKTVAVASSAPEPAVRAVEPPWALAARAPYQSRAPPVLL